MTRVPPSTSGRCVVHVADFSAPFETNFVSSLVNLSKAAQAHLGLDSVFVFPERARGLGWLREISEAGIPVRFLELNSSHRDRVAALRRIGTESRSVIFHSHFGTFDVDVAYAASRVGAAAIWHMHSPYPSFRELRRRVGERIKFLLLARVLVDRIVAVSPSVAETAGRHGGPRRRIVVVLNGVDLDRVRPVDDRTRSLLRAKRGVAEDVVAFLLFGWDPTRKGVDVLARAVDVVPRLTPHGFCCLVVGREDNLESLRETVSNVSYLQVVRPVEDVRDLYGVADCFVSASRVEGLPYAIGEAMASGLPVISSDLPQVIETYGLAGRGLVPFRTGDAEDLAAAMARVLSLPVEERRHLGRQNATFARNHLSVDRWAEGIIAVYRSIMAQRFPQLPQP
jgi:glycosyltransferase involved in cell wall biosynthesis